MSRKSLGRKAGLKMALLAVGAAAAVAACSSSTTNSVSPTSPMTSSAAAGTPSSVICQHVSSLRASLTSLTQLTLSANAAGQIRKDILNIQTQLAALKGQVTGAFAADLDQLNAAVNQVSKAAQNMASPPTPAQIQAVITALTNLKARAATALAAMNAACPGT